MDTIEYDKEEADEQTPDGGFGDIYIGTRYQEKRLLSDGQVMFLPDIEPTHIHYKEWLLRKRSALRLVDYLSKKNEPLTILEIGCGNGWLSSKLSAIPGAHVTGLDINQVEILQAKRIFAKNNLKFIWSGFEPAILKGKKFDIILFAASIQYFSSVKEVLENAFPCLADDGEIHIMDTHFYKPEELKLAVQRTENYYKELGYPEMTAYYFHHCINDIRQFKHTILVNPSSLLNRIGRKEPFYWIAVTR